MIGTSPEERVSTSKLFEEAFHVTLNVQHLPKCLKELKTISKAAKLLEDALSRTFRLV